MKTWRERIAEARERGTFTEEDRRAASAYATCAVSEHPVCYIDGVVAPGNLRDELMAPGEVIWDAGGDFYLAVIFSDFAEAERLHDAIEDRALQLKREAGGGHVADE